MDYLDIINELSFNIINKSNSKISIKGCPYCNDGKSRKPRGFFLLKGDQALYFCHNCVGDGNSIKSIYDMCIDERRPDLAVQCLENEDYNPYVLEDGESVPLDTDITYLKKPDLVIGKSRKIKMFALDDKLKNYLVNERHIPESALKHFLKTDSGFVIIYRNQKGIYNAQEKNEGGYFFINNDKTSSFALSNVFNLFNINPTAPVIVTEGVIDSLFIKNAISIGGVSKWKTIYKTMDFCGLKSIYFLQDNDHAGETIARKVIDENIYVFKWKQFIDDYEMEDEINDVNDLYKCGYVKNMLTFIQLRKYFTNSQSELMFV